MIDYLQHLKELQKANELKVELIAPTTYEWLVSIQLVKKDAYMQYLPYALAYMLKWNERFNLTLTELIDRVKIHDLQAHKKSKDERVERMAKKMAVYEFVEAMVELKQITS